MTKDEALKYISIDPAIRFGKPCIKGTRITIADILSWLSNGMTTAEIISDFPELKEDHIFAALAFAAGKEKISKYIAA